MYSGIDSWSNNGATLLLHNEGYRMDKDMPASAHDRADSLLAQRAQIHDDLQRARLLHEAVIATMDLAELAARRYANRGIDLEDLVQVACLALVKAANRYEPDRGTRFAAYATPTITGELKRYFRDHAWTVRPPRQLQELRAEVLAEEDRLRHLLHREPSVGEVAAALALDCAQVRNARQCSIAYHAVPLEWHFADHDGPMELMATDASTCDRVERRHVLSWALRELTDRELKIIRMRFVDERTQADIGAVLGISQMQVSRLLTSILARLRAELTSVEEPDHPAAAAAR